jgi:hypothetical protein
MSEYETQAIGGHYSEGEKSEWINAIDLLEQELNERGKLGWDPFKIMPERADEGNGTIIGYEVVWVKRVR